MSLQGFRQLEKEGGLASLCAVGDRWARRHARIRRREREEGSLHHHHHKRHRQQQQEGTPSPNSRSSSSSALAGEAGVDAEVEEILMEAKQRGPPASPVDEGTGLLGDERLRQ